MHRYWFVELLITNHRDQTQYRGIQFIFQMKCNRNLLNVWRIFFIYRIMNTLNTVTERLGHKQNESYSKCKWWIWNVHPFVWYKLLTIPLRVMIQQSIKRTMCVCVANIICLKLTNLNTCLNSSIYNSMKCHICKSTWKLNFEIMNKKEREVETWRTTDSVLCPPKYSYAWINRALFSL